MVKIINPSVEILTELDEDKILKHLELCIRNCYKSEDKISADSSSSKQMISKIIELDHTAMLEHFSITARIMCDVGCYDDKTMVLTDKGWKYFRDVSLLDSVYTMDDNGDVFLYDKVLPFFKRYKGIMHNYHSTQVNLCVTPDHNMWVFDTHKRSKKTKIWKFLESSQLTNKSYHFDKSPCKVEKQVKQEIIISPVKRKMGFYEKQFDGHKFDSEDFFEFLGWWITDGNIEKSGNYANVCITQVKQRGRERIEYLLKKLNIGYSCYKNRYRLKSPALSEFILKEFYRGKNHETGYYKSFDMKISEFIRTAGTNEIRRFLKGVLGGNGTEYEDGRKIIYTASKQFALDLIELCFKCGVTANYYRNDVSKYENSFNQKEPVYVVSMVRTEKHWFDKNEKNYSESEYDGFVYCINLPEHHRLFVMREGKTCWCGNCYKDLTRHRHASFAIESTRYCNYSKGKFDNEIAIIKPCNIKEGTVEYDIWLDSMMYMENAYMEMARIGCKPDQLRMLLPHSTAACVMMTANIREWLHIFKLRCHSAAHPSVVEVMTMLRDELAKKLPTLFTNKS